MNKLFVLTDDDNDDAELFGEAIEMIEAPVDFYHAESCRGLLEYLEDEQNKKPDVIFLDINMPEISGWQCLTDLKNNVKLKDIPVIMYTTSSSSMDKKIAFDSGALGFLTKPTDFKLLIRILDSIAKEESINLDSILKKLSSL
ncbi:MAG: response regulator [Saprospiraceae bacterium]